MDVKPSYHSDHHLSADDGQGRNRSALHAFRNSSKRHFLKSKIRSNHLSCKMLGIHGASWHFLTLLRLCLPTQLEYCHFPGVSRISHTVNHKPRTGIGEGFARRVREARRCASRKNCGIWPGGNGYKGLIRTIRKKASAARLVPHGAVFYWFYSLQFGKGSRLELRNPLIRSRMDERR